MKQYRVDAHAAVDADIETAFDWYEAEQLDLGLEFLHQLGAAYHRILEGPFRYEELRSGIRRSFTKRFPYCIYFAVEGDVIVILAVLHTARDPAEWQLRIE